MKPRSRILRIAAALPLLVILCAARTSVSPLPQTIGPDSTLGTKFGETITVHKGDVLLRGLVYDTKVVRIEAPVSVAIAKFSQDIPAGTPLDPVIAPKNTTRLTGADGRIYCGENQRTRSEFMDKMIGDWFSKYETIVRFCFVDTDDDHRLDHVFLAGAKDKADQASIPITPTPYRLEAMQRAPDAATLELRVKKFQGNTERNWIELELQMTRNGAPTGFTYIATVVDGRLKQTYQSFWVDPTKTPYPVYFNDILGGAITISRVDAKAGEADIVIRRPFKMQLFKPITIEYSYVYIYY